MGANSALIFGIIINVAILLVFFRFLMQLGGINAYNPVVMSTVKATKIGTVPIGFNTENRAANR